MVHLEQIKRQFGARIMQPETHRVADANLDRQFVRHLLAHSHQPVDERHHEAVPVSAGHIFQVTPRPHACFKGRVNDFAVRVHACLAALEFELVENVIIRRTCQHTGLFQARFLDQAKVTFDSANPSRAFRKLVP